ncbi:MAG: hypothetical protein M3R13_11725 [Armatimonadota bacterium]|nr:hypothetical protein [Armatimonadota bacterium]
MNNKKLLAGIMAVGALVVLTGCARHADVPPPFSNLTKDLDQEFAATAPEPPLAGTARPLQPLSREELIATSRVTRASRNNPFALFGEELQFQTGIRFENILSQLPQSDGYAYAPPMFIVPEQPIPSEMVVPEAQPYRRLSGVYFGDTVSAIIEMEDGKPYLIMPGSRVGDTEWYVESIDAEKAVLVRSGNKVPKRIIVRLETPPAFGTGNTGGGNQPDQGGGRGGSRGGGGIGPAPQGGGGGIGN